MKRKARFLNSIPIVIVILALVVVGTVLAAAVAVDTFNEGVQDLTADPTNNSSSGFATGATSNIIGGERDTQVNWQSGSGEVKVEIDRFGSDRFVFSQGPGVTGDALLQWDGSDASMTRQYALGADLTDGGTNDSFVLRLLANDLSVGITLRLYTDASNWSYYSLNTPGSIPDGSTVDVVIPFTSFSTGGGTGASFNSVGAVEMAIDGTTNQGADMSLDFLQTNVTRDYGDLPSGYPVTSTDNGARHIAQGLRLGNNIDTEADGQPSAGADGDDTADADDEDGVVPTSGVKWSVGSPPTNGGSVDVTVNGCSGTCYLSGWINWNTGTDTDFNDTGEQIFTDQAVTNGTQTLTFSIPTGVTFPNTFDARFRLCGTSGTCTAVTGEVTNGEVEDYQWDFGPNAVTLREMEAHSVNHGGWALVPITIGLMVIGAVGLFAVARRRRDSASE